MTFNKTFELQPEVWDHSIPLASLINPVKRILRDEVGEESQNFDGCRDSREPAQAVDGVLYYIMSDSPVVPSESLQGDIISIKVNPPPPNFLPNSPHTGRRWQTKNSCQPLCKYRG